MIETSN